MDYEQLANAALIVITGVLSYLGIKKGIAAQPEAKPATASSTVEVAGALVDSASVKVLAGEIAGHSLALTGQTHVSKEILAALKAQTEAVQAVAAQIKRHNERQDEEEEKRIERERDALERENERLKRENEVLGRGR